MFSSVLKKNNGARRGKLTLRAMLRLSRTLENGPILLLVHVECCVDYQIKVRTRTESHIKSTVYKLLIKSAYERPRKLESWCKFKVFVV